MKGAACRWQKSPTDNNIAAISITAQTVELANERNDIDILRRRLDASVLLIKALGGGWNVSNLPTLGAPSGRDY